MCACLLRVCACVFAQSTLPPLPPPAPQLAQAANFPFCTIEPNIGRVAIPDPRLNLLAAAARSAKTIHSQLEFVDIAGLVKGASAGAGLGNKFLGHVRQVPVIAHVVRALPLPPMCFCNI